LIRQFGDLRKDAPRLKYLIKEKTEQFRSDLDEQYKVIFEELPVDQPVARERSSDVG